MDWIGLDWLIIRYTIVVANQIYHSYIITLRSIEYIPASNLPVETKPTFLKPLDIKISECSVFVVEMIHHYSCNWSKLF